MLDYQKKYIGEIKINIEKSSDIEVLLGKKGLIVFYFNPIGIPIFIIQLQA